MISSLSEYLEASEPSRRERAENWRVGIGLQKVDGLEVSPYLCSTFGRQNWVLCSRKYRMFTNRMSL